MIPLPSAVKTIKKKENLNVFEIEGLYPGYGVTIGNSMRRVLLSSLEGAAITQVKIKGVQHELSTIPFVLEDVVSIILNLKQLRFKMHTDEPQKATLKVKGEKEVKGSDFELVAQVELVNKDFKIATLTDKKAELEMEIQIEKGIGYLPVEKRGKKEKLEVGQLAIDAIFTPIKRVNFNVENMRVGERTDFDRLKIEVETDGTIPPETALSKAVEILEKQFSFIEGNLKEKDVQERILAEKTAVKEKAAEAEDVLKKKVEDLNISKRTINALLNNNIKTVSGLLRKNETSLSELEGMGDQGLKEIKKILKKLGLELKSNE